MVLRGRRSFKRFLVILITFFISGICINSYTGSFSQSDGFIVTFEELLEGPVVLQQNDTQLLEHIRENVFINPEDYEGGGPNGSRSDGNMQKHGKWENACRVWTDGKWLKENFPI